MVLSRIATLAQPLSNTRRAQSFRTIQHRNRSPARVMRVRSQRAVLRIDSDNALLKYHIVTKRSCVIMCTADW
jgi:hypothetical protein